jgi:hypothetical protein
MAPETESFQATNHLLVIAVKGVKVRKEEGGYGVDNGLNARKNRATVLVKK